MDLIYFSPLFLRWAGGGGRGVRGVKESYCPQLVKERSEIKKREFGEGWGWVLGWWWRGDLLFPEDNISFEGAAERKAEGAEVAPAGGES